jgi:hypothetical protein
MQKQLVCQERNIVICKKSKVFKRFGPARSVEKLKMSIRTSTVWQTDEADASGSFVERRFGMFPLLRILPCQTMRYKISHAPDKKRFNSME